MKTETADVIIIGGGVIGASVAFHLARKKISVIVLEAEDLASGSSGACDGLVFLQSKKPGIHLQLAMESKKRFDQLQAAFPFSVEYKNNGGMVVIETEAELEAMRLFVAEQREIGLDVSLLDTGEARELEPGLSPAILGATCSPLDGQINPIALTLAFARAAQMRGARIFPHTPARAIDVRQGRVRAVKTDRDRFGADTVVNAAGVFAPEIGKMAGIDIPVRPRRGQLLVTEAGEPVLRRCLISARYIAAKFNPELAKSGGQGVSVEQTASGNLLLGSTREFVGFDKGTTPEGIRAIAGRAARLLPCLRQMNVIRAFAGLRPYTPDGLPILGPAEGLDGFVIAAGHEGDGIALSAITGELIAQLIAEGHTDIPLDDFSPGRFA
ncbi:FAD-dependent oxidoreductase [Desulfonema ishimotonii]|uniref:FAD-dependent oxidoreductase n=1 Tax=Desulfonema ishimotonii TaxID=45657 RepID=A0A401G1Z8_9BACT|nr:FAD-binding oxidoreductase [Desulfonema ishimotonii]GBC63237.1 FAD-dependent oxidoreductase [Desulfonema ishimotonii]